MSAGRQIAILAWGSLLWDRARSGDFAQLHDPWRAAGPSIKLEFSRISRSRNGALTLVVDPENGESNTVCYSISKRERLEETIDDLRQREGTTIGNIGFVQLDGPSRCRDQASCSSIEEWALRRGLRAVIWTDL